MKYYRTFTDRDSLLELVSENYNIIPVLSRFSIPLGFGNKTIGKICKTNDIDCELFLTIINFILTGSLDYSRIKLIRPLSLVDFLRRSHDYFIDYKFPHIRANLVDALDEHHSDVNPSIIDFFDTFVGSVKAHFKYEEDNLFPYIRGLVNGEHSDYNISVFRRQHVEVSESLNELKNIILQFYDTDVPNRMYDVLVDIYNCEEDLDTHADIENHVLIPLISGLEKQREGGEMK